MRKETLQYIYKKIRPYKRTVFGLSGIAIVAAVLDTVIPVLYGMAIDTVIAHDAITTLALIIGAWFTLRMSSDWLRRELALRGERMAFNLTRQVEREAFAHVIALPASYHHAHKGGVIREQINNFRNSLESFINRGLFDLAPMGLTVVLITGYLFWLDVRLGVAILVVIGLFLWSSKRLIPALDAAWNARDKTLQKRYGRMWDALMNISIVKANSTEVFERRNLQRSERELYESKMAVSRLFRWNSAIQDTTFAFGTAMLLFITSFLVADGQLTPGLIATVLGYAFTVWGLIRMYVWIRWDISSVDAYFKSFSALMSEKEESYGIGKKITIHGGVEYQHVRFRYREEKAVLEDVSFKVTPGQVIAIVGESGEGKTTIMELLFRYFEPQQGEILVDGTPVNEIELGSLRKQLAYVPQDLSLFHDTLRQNIRYGRLDASDRQVEEAAKLASLHDWARHLPEKYDTVVGERGLKLSAGERQRVALARAFLRNPRILVLDEPTSNLDASTEAAIQQSLSTLMKGRTTFIIAHRLRTVQEADRILVLQNGRIVEQGTHEELMHDASGVYRRLRNLQFQELTQEG